MFTSPKGLHILAIAHVIIFCAVISLLLYGEYGLQVATLSEDLTDTEGFLEAIKAAIAENFAENATENIQENADNFRQMSMGNAEDLEEKAQTYRYMTLNEPVSRDWIEMHKDFLENPDITEIDAANHRRTIVGTEAILVSMDRDMESIRNWFDENFEDSDALYFTDVTNATDTRVYDILNNESIRQRATAALMDVDGDQLVSKAVDKLALDEVISQAVDE